MNLEDIQPFHFDEIFGGKLDNKDVRELTAIKMRVDYRIAEKMIGGKFPLKFRPFIARVGGKTRIADQIVNLIPPHKIYVEPFIGGGSVFLKQQSEEEIINDLDRDIYHLWIDMKAIGDKVKFMNFKCSRAIFNRLKAANPKAPFERLYRNLYLSKFSFSSLRTSFVGEKQCKTERFSNVGKNLKANGAKYKERLKHVRIFNQDFEKMIEKFDSPETFFYFDPPYVTLKGNWGYFPITPDTIWNALKNIKGRFILSYENIEDIKQLFSAKKYEKKIIKTVYQISGKDQDATEILIIK